MTTVTVLNEHETQVVELTRTEAEALHRTGYVTVTPATETGWEITTHAHVGSLVVGDLRVLIRPKIRPENLFLLLEPGLSPEDWRDANFYYAATDDLLPAMIMVFTRVVETALARGVLRSYHERHEELVALRGRVDLPQHFRRAGILTPMASKFDEFSADILENQVLRASIQLALRVPRIGPQYRQVLRQQLASLENVSDLPDAATRIEKIHLSRLNQHYWSALGLAQLILENLSLRDRVGQTTSSAFMVDMNELFERFIALRLRKYLRGQLSIAAQNTVDLAHRGQVRMRPDLLFHDAESQPRLVADIKYKLTDTAQAKADDYYQLLAYTTALDLPHGLLIYCRQPGDPHSSTVTIKNSGQKLTVYALNLTGSTAEVEHELRQLAELILEQAAAA